MALAERILAHASICRRMRRRCFECVLQAHMRSRVLDTAAGSTHRAACLYTPYVPHTGHSRATLPACVRIGWLVLLSTYMVLMPSTRRS